MMVIITTVEPPVTFSLSMQVILSADKISFSIDGAPVTPGCTDPNFTEFNSLVQFR